MNRLRYNAELFSPMDEKSTAWHQSSESGPVSHASNSRINMVSFLLGSTVVSGVNSYYRTLASYLTQQGHQVTTVVVEPGAGAIFDSLGPDIGSIELFSLCCNRYRTIWKLLCRKKPKIVLHHYLDYGLQGTAIARFHGEQFHNIYICHADTDYHYGKIARYYPIIDHVVAASPTCAHEVGRRFPDKFANPLVLPAGVDVPKQCIEMPSDDPLVLVYSGRMEQPQKRVLDFIPLVQSLESLGVVCELHLVGEGPCVSQLRHRLSQKWVYFHGRVSPERMQNLWRQGHVMVLMSAFEGTCVSLLEAMAHGLVPLVTRTRGMEDVIEHGRNGLLFAVGDVDEAVRLLLTLMNDRDLARRLGIEARRTVEHEFSARQMASTFSRYVKALGPPILTSRESARPFLRRRNLGIFDKAYVPNVVAYYWRTVISPPLMIMKTAKRRIVDM